jgi:PTH1 family peptidyl-tRNA hydrolase
MGETRLLKPLTYMNRSGEAVREWLSWLKLTVQDLLVVVDDVSLPLGQLRFRENGSHGGHNGLRSIEAELGTESYTRLKCGVGPLPVGQSLEGFVLGRFAGMELAVVQEMIGAASTAVQCCQQQGITIAMQVFNTKLKEKSEEKR